MTNDRIKISFLILFSSLLLSLPVQALHNISHRGAAGLAPENTLMGIKTALAVGVDVIDIDLALTQDDVLVLNATPKLIPDLTLTSSGKWLTDPSLAIAKMTYSSLKSYRVGKSRLYKTMRAEYPYQFQSNVEKIPTLQEIIEVLKTHGATDVQLQIDLKTNPDLESLSAQPENIVSALVKILRDNGLTSRVQVQSFDWRNLLLIQRMAPEITTSYLSNHSKLISLSNKEAWTAGFAGKLDDVSSYPQLIHRLGGKIWSTFYQDLNSDLLNEAHKLGLKVIVWTIDDPQTMINMIQMGVDGIVTNRPDILRGLLAARGYRVPTGGN